MNIRTLFARKRAVLGAAVTRKRWSLVLWLAAACVLFQTMEAVGHANERRYIEDSGRFLAREWKGWRFSVVSLSPNWDSLRWFWMRPIQSHLIGRRHFRVRCTEFGHSLQPCQAPETYEHSETIRFLWLSWKRQLSRAGDCPEDIGNTLHIS